MDLTRRGLLGRAAAIAGGAALARPAAVFAGPAGEAVFEMRLPRDGTAPITAARRFELLGIEWSGGGDPGIEVRVHGDDGRWSDWLAAPLHHGHAPDGTDDQRRLTDPVWTGPAHVFQLRA